MCVGEGTFIGYVFKTQDCTLQVLSLRMFAMVPLLVG